MSERYAIDFSAEQLRYLQRLIAGDVAQNTSIIRSAAFVNYGPNESEQIHTDIRVGAAILGSLPRVPKVSA